MTEAFDIISLEITVDPNIDTQNTLIPPMILQPFVENAIWHGMAKQESEGAIHVRYIQHSKQLTMTVEDNGPGRHEKTLQDSTHPTSKTSMGVSITRARLEMLMAEHGGRTDLRFVDLQQGLRVDVEVPLVLIE